MTRCLAPLFVLSSNGGGRTVVPCAAALHWRRRDPNAAQHTLALRIVGLTTATLTLRGLLHGLCSQISRALDHKPPPFPDDPIAARDQLRCCLNLSSATQPVVIAVIGRPPA